MIAATISESDFDAALDVPMEHPAAPEPIPQHEDEPLEPSEPADDAPASPESEAGRTLAAAKRTKEGRKQSIQREIDERIAQREAVGRERDAVAKELAALRAERDSLKQPRAEPAPSQGASPDDPEPKEDAFETYGAYVKAQARWEARQEIKATTERAALARRATEKQQLDTDRRSKHDDRVEAFRATRADFDAVMAAGDAAGVRLSPPMIEAVMESEIGPQLMVHLAEHPDEYRRIVNSPRPLMAYREMSKLEARLEAAATGPAPVASVSQAKPPLKPVGSAPSTGDSDSEPAEDEPIESFITRGNRAERKRRA